MPQTGFICSTPAAVSLDNGLTPYAVLSDPFPTGFCNATGSTEGLLTNLGQNLFILDRNAKQPYVQTWNFGIQRKLPGNTVARSRTRVARRTPDGHSGMESTRPEVSEPGRATEQPGTQSRTTASSRREPVDANHHARSVLATVPAIRGRFQQKRELRQLDLPRHAGSCRTSHVQGTEPVAAYTLAKQIDDMIPSVNGFPGESFSGAPPQNFYDLRGERALSSWDTPQTLVLSYVYELPFGPGKPFCLMAADCWARSSAAGRSTATRPSRADFRSTSTAVMRSGTFRGHTASKLERSEPDA